MYLVNAKRERAHFPCREEFVIFSAFFVLFFCLTTAHLCQNFIHLFAWVYKCLFDSKPIQQRENKAKRISGRKGRTITNLTVTHPFWMKNNDHPEKRGRIENGWVFFLAVFHILLQRSTYA